MAAVTFDPYAVLGVARNATDAEIRVAYRELVARYHPDKHAGNPLEGLAAEKMAEINRAYEILSDSRRRSAYDGGAGGFREAAGPGWTRPAPGKNSRLVKIIAVLFALPLLFRFGRGLLGLLAAGGRAALQGLHGLRGTPFALFVALGLLGLFVFLLVRRRRAKNKRS
jgi:hypothetical protein